MNGDLKIGEPHPAVYDAYRWIKSLPIKELCILTESFASCAIENNREAEICLETLNRITEGRPVSDRYVLGLAWYIRHIIGTKNGEQDDRRRAKKHKDAR